MRYYAIIDTNVIVSALLKTGSVPGQVTAEALIGDIIPVINEEILSEYKEVLHRPKFCFNTQKVDVFLEEIVKRSVYSDYGAIDEELPDEKDIVFYAVFLEKRKSDEAYLVTGNLKHFPVSPYIVSPNEMLKILKNNKKNEK